jgi:hypothetical protein
MVGMALHFFRAMVDSRETGKQALMASGMSPHIYLSTYLSIYS